MIAEGLRALHARVNSAREPRSSSKSPDDEHRSLDATIIAALEQYVAARNHRAKVRDLAADVAQRDADLSIVWRNDRLSRLDDSVEIAQVVLGSPPKVRDYGLLPRRPRAPRQ